MSAPSAPSQPAAPRTGSVHVPSAQQRLPYFPLLILGGAIFVSVTSEFLPTGLLPDMAADLRVSQSQIGLLVTAFAATVVLTTAPLAVVTRRFSRKWLMIVLLSVFAISNIFAGMAETYELLVAARILGGLAHGLFWAVTGPYAAHLVPPHLLARAIAVTTSGGTLAFIIGVPIGTALGHALGWRSAFLVMAGVVVFFTILVVLFLPPVKHIEDLSTGEIRLPTRRDPTVLAVVAVCVSVILIVLGHNLLYTYIAPWLIEIASFGPDAIPGLLLGYGIAGAVGLILAGVFGDRFPRATFATFLIGVMAGVVLLTLSANSPVLVVVALVVWSASFGGLPSMLHARVLHAASRNIRDIAAAFLTTSFNFAIGGGALLGGIILDSFGLIVLPWALVAFVAVALVFVLVTDARRVARTHHH
ncbi:MAG: MFS transporter [Microbacteriaceae bacterium]